MCVGGSGERLLRSAALVRGSDPHHYGGSSAPETTIACTSASYRSDARTAGCRRRYADSGPRPRPEPRGRTSMRIAVVALGKIGLPLAAQFARAGHEVVGVDINAELVATVNRGEEPFPGEAHLAETLAELVPAGRLRATTDYAEAIPGADAVVVVVPLFVDEATAQ